MATTFQTLPQNAIWANLYSELQQLVGVLFHHYGLNQPISQFLV